MKHVREKLVFRFMPREEKFHTEIKRDVLTVASSAAEFLKSIRTGMSQWKLPGSASEEGTAKSRPYFFYHGVVYHEYAPLSQTNKVLRTCEEKKVSEAYGIVSGHRQPGSPKKTWRKCLEESLTPMDVNP